VLLAAAVFAGARWWQERNRTDLERALAYAPADTVRFSWTDWAGVRAELEADLDTESSGREVADFLSEGFDADLTSTSSMVDSAEPLQSKFGFSPAVVDWELLSQGTQGAVAVMGLPDSVDIEELGDTFEGLGFVRPESTTGVWKGGEELLARLGPGISPQFNNLALDPDRHLLLASDSATYLGQALKAVDDDSDHGLDEVADAVGNPLSAALYTGDQACRALAMSQADDGEQDAARREHLLDVLVETDARREVVHVHEDAVAAEVARQLFVDVAGVPGAVHVAVADEDFPGPRLGAGAALHFVFYARLIIIQ